MALGSSPNSPRLSAPFVNRDGRLSQDGLSIMEAIWRQVAAGYVVVPCEASGTNAIALTPILHEEGGATYADHVLFSAVAAATATGAVTGAVGDLDALKVYKDAGATQAGSGDIVAGSLYLFGYNAALDSGAGGLVLFGGAFQAAGNYQPLATYLTTLAGYGSDAVLQPYMAPKGFLFGIVPSNGTDATNDIDFSAGLARDSTNAVTITAAALTKQLDANWAAGTNQGMRYSGAAIANTTYHLYVAAKADGTQDYYADPSATEATALGHLQAETGGASYAYIRRIGTLLRESASIVAGRWVRQAGGSLRFIRATIVNDVATSNPGTSAVTATLSVATGITVTALYAASLVDASPGTFTAMLLSALTQTDTTPSVSLLSLIISAAGASVNQSTAGNFMTETNTSGQIRYRLNTSTADHTIRLTTIGYDDNCGVSA